MSRKRLAKKVKGISQKMCFPSPISMSTVSITIRDL